VKLLKTIRLDPSDTFVFENAAEPGEWAVTGTFMFSDIDPATLQGKARTAFRAGFLGIGSFGWSTLVQIVTASEEDQANAIRQLATQLRDRLGAPDLQTAEAAAREEMEFARSLCEPHDADTLIAMHRAADSGDIRETFRSLKPKADRKAFRAFTFLDTDGEEEQDTGETVDLMSLVQGDRR
jgi:hypothetical protein